MKKRIVALALFGLLASGCADDSDVDDPPPSDDSPADSADECVEPLDSALARWETAGFSGAVSASSPALRCFAGYGRADDEGQPNTADTLYSIGSISKLVTAAGVLTLVDARILDIDDTVGRWIPELSADKAAITLEQLLGHSSGLRQTHGADQDPLTQADALAAIDAMPLLFSPGTDYAYSNSGYTVLAMVVERASGRAFRDYMIDEVMTLADGRRVGGFWHGEPAVRAARATGYFDDGTAGETGDFDGPHWAREGNGGMAFTARGLHDWTRALTSGEILSSEALETMTRPRVPPNDGIAEAFGWLRLEPDVLGETAFGTSGGGGDTAQEAVLLWLPESDQVLVVTSNRTTVGAESLAGVIAFFLIDGSTPVVPNEGVAVDPADLQTRSGTYRMTDDSRLTVDAEESRLRLSARGPAALAALFPLPVDADPDAFATHESLVDEFFSGGTPAGRAELDLIEAEFGPVSSVELAGSGYIDGEVRTFVELIVGGEPATVWIALDEFGIPSGISVSSRPDPRYFVSSSESEFVPQIELPGETPVAIEFDERSTELHIVTGGERSIAERLR